MKKKKEILIKEFEINSLIEMANLMKETSFTVDELMNAQKKDIELEPHLLTINKHPEVITYELYQRLIKWMANNQNQYLFGKYDGNSFKYSREDDCVRDTDKQKVYINTPSFTGRNVSITELARAIGKDPQFIRFGLKEGFLPFGYAYKKENSNVYTYYCPDKKVWEETGYYRKM